jgi:hypothetical protein
VGDFESSKGTYFDPGWSLLIRPVTDYRANREFNLAVKRVPQGQPIQRGTRFVARELLGALLVDTDSTVNRHDAVDICHAVVPASYCDFVLLDRRWAVLVERARKRITDGGLAFPIAKVYSERGLEDFLTELRSDSGAAGTGGAVRGGPARPEGYEPSSL